MSRLPAIKIHAEAPHSFAANIPTRIHKTKQPFGFIARKERRVEEFGYPIHVVGVSKVKRDLHILIGVFHLM
jgi:hypothetical protein